MNIHKELHQGLDDAGPERLGYVRRAFEHVRAIDRPRILDAGCGKGDVTIELARLGGGEVIGIDIDGEVLGRFAARIKEEGLEGRVRAVHCSLLELPFPPESFDVVWAEGSLHIAGMEKSLRALHGFIRRGGFLVAHEMAWIRSDPPDDALMGWKARFPGILSIDEICGYVDKYNYRMIEHFALPDDFWSRHYYEPLEGRIASLREKYSDNPEALAILDREQREADLYSKSASWMGSAYVVMQRDDE